MSESVEKEILSTLKSINNFMKGNSGGAGRTTQRDNSKPADGRKELLEFEKIMGDFLERDGQAYEEANNKLRERTLLTAKHNDLVKEEREAQNYLASIIKEQKKVAQEYYEIQEGINDLKKYESEITEDVTKKTEELVTLKEDLDSLDTSAVDYAERKAEIEEQILDITEELKANEEARTAIQYDLMVNQEKSLKLSEKLKEINDETLNVNNKILETQRELANMPSKLGRIFNDFNKIINKTKEAWSGYKNFTEPWVQADEAASKFARTVGMTSKEMGKLRDGAISNVANKIARDFNMSTAELLAAQESYLKGAGRNIRMSDEDQQDMAAIKRVAGDKGIEMASAYDNFGISMEGTAKSVTKMFNEATKQGILFDKYAENVSKNIKMAQTYKFKDGVNGLEKMAKKATALKLDMQMVANFADKVSTIEGAMETAAKLQVLGGPFASMADPMGLLNEGLTDMNGLQDRVVNMIQGMGYFDKSTGQVNVSAFDMRRIKAMADATGMDYANIMESVHAQGRRNEIGNQLKASSKFSSLDEDTRELLMNTGTFNKDGKAGVTIDGKFKALEDLDLSANSDDRKALEAIQKTESDNIRDIALDVRSLREQREGMSKTKDAVQAQMASPFTKFESGVLDILGSMGKGLNIIMGAVVAIQMAQGIGNFLDLGKGKGKGVSRIFKGGLKRSAKRMGLKAFGRKGMNFFSKGAGNVMSKGAGNGISKFLGSTMSKGAGNAITNTALKTGAKSTVGAALKGAGKSVLKGGLAGAAGGIGLGIVGELGNHFTDKAVAEGKMKVGGTGHTLAKAGSQAAKYAGIGMALGSVIPGVGSAIGAALGAVTGAVVGVTQAAKAKNKKVVDEQLSKKGLELKGDYGNGKLKKIDKALQTGEISDRLRRRLIADGNMSVVEEIERVKKEKDAEKAAKGEDEEGKTKKGKFAVSKASIIIKNANIAGLGGLLGANMKNVGNNKGLFSRLATGANSTFGLTKAGLLSGLFGKKGDEKNDTGLFAKMMKNGEALLNPKKMLPKIFKHGEGMDSSFINTLLMSNPITASLGLLNKTANIFGKKETGKSSNWTPIEINNNTNKSNGQPINNNNQTIGNKPFDININGTLKLTSDNGQSVDIISELKRNPTILRTLSEMIAKEMNTMTAGVNRVHRPGDTTR
jgi:hypothetical protein